PRAFASRASVSAFMQYLFFAIVIGFDFCLQKYEQYFGQQNFSLKMFVFLRTIVRRRRIHIILCLLSK
ncbi:MAG: hypothetical protein J6034_07065, partial [Bacteroidaceae bacterium]|nr:hypothetical protein [Bacteroidaceae bacterium]